MTDEPTPDADSLLDRHIDALRTGAVPNGPSPELLATTLAVLRRSPASEPCGVAAGWQIFLETLMTLSRRPLVRTAFVAVLGCGVYFLLFSAFGTSAAFADVAARLKEAKTLTYTMSVATPAAPAQPAMTSKVYVRGTNQYRMESGDFTTICSDQKALSLIATTHTATRLDLANAPASKAVAAMDDPGRWLRNLATEAATPIGEKTIDGVKAAGFTTRISGNPVTIWADPKTSDPVRIEWAMPVGMTTANVVMSDFKFDVPLDDALFSLDPPAGYTVKTQTLTLPTLGNTEDEVAKLLGEYADVCGGAFPDGLTNWYAFIEASEKADPRVRSELMGRVGAISAKLFGLPNGYGYTGGTAHRGEKDKVIFWIKPDAGVKTAKAVYADLHVADVGVDSLPATQSATRDDKQHGYHAEGVDSLPATQSATQPVR